MKTFFAIALLCLSSAFAQTKQPSVTVTYSITGSFSAPVAAFSLVGTCQPGPAPAFPACALPTPSLGLPYSVTLPTAGINAPVTCAVSSGSLPGWASLTVNGTSCVISGTPNSAVPMNFSLTASGQ